MKEASPKLPTAHLTANEEALLRCQTALEQNDPRNPRRPQRRFGNNAASVEGWGERHETAELTFISLRTAAHGGSIFEQILMPRFDHVGETLVSHT